MSEKINANETVDVQVLLGRQGYLLVLTAPDSQPFTKDTVHQYGQEIGMLPAPLLFVTIGRSLSFLSQFFLDEQLIVSVNLLVDNIESLERATLEARGLPRTPIRQSVIEALAIACKKE